MFECLIKILKALPLAIRWFIYVSSQAVSISVRLWSGELAVVLLIDDSDKALWIGLVEFYIVASHQVYLAGKSA